MHLILPILQLVVGFSILNVWLVQNRKATRWRGGDAKTIREEFEVYGLPDASVYVVGTIKVVLAVLLIVGIWIPGLVLPASVGLAVLLAGSVLMHLKVRDPLFKSLPAALFLSMCLVIAWFSLPA